MVSSSARWPWFLGVSAAVHILVIFAVISAGFLLREKARTRMEAVDIELDTTGAAHPDLPSGSRMKTAAAASETGEYGTNVADTLLPGGVTAEEWAEKRLKESPKTAMRSAIALMHPTNAAYSPDVRHEAIRKWFQQLSPAEQKKARKLLDQWENGAGLSEVSFSCYYRTDPRIENYLQWKREVENWEREKKTKLLTLQKWKLIGPWTHDEAPKPPYDEATIRKIERVLIPEDEKFRKMRTGNRDFYRGVMGVQEEIDMDAYTNGKSYGCIPG
jgi:hypothetical protein